MVSLAKRAGANRRERVKMLFTERALWEAGLERIAGVDEVGMGPLAGPVVAAAVVLSPKVDLDGVRDSKLLSAKQRERLESAIQLQLLQQRHPGCSSSTGS